MKINLYPNKIDRPDILKGDHWTPTAKELWCNEEWLLKRMKEQLDYVESIRERRINKQWTHRLKQLAYSAIDMQCIYADRLHFLRTGVYHHELIG